MPGLFLIVDDEESISSALGRLASSVLASTGARVVIAASPVEAFAALGSCAPGETIVVLSDFNMGTELSGLDLLEWVKEHKPDAHRFLMSGYAAAELEADLQRPIDVTCLPKPFGLDSLQAAFAPFRGPMQAA